jgi:CRISPR/Cas system CSM-associated protein Csm2 small subunit/tRNA A-37 threonylcarbamoyl transferase component Bud32
MRFLFTPPVQDTAGLLTLPWHERLEEWEDDRLVEVRHAGLHRHVVRFVVESDVLFVLKELPEDLARREYRLLHTLRDLAIPAVAVVGVCADRPDEMDAVLVTRFLEYSTTYRTLLGNQRPDVPLDPLLDAMVQLLVRLHLAGVMWGDCSLSNTLFRPDAEKLAAYLVDAETAEMHSRLSDGQRDYDLELAFERIAGELFDLEAGGLLPEDVDPITLAEDIVGRYRALWHEVTRTDVFDSSEQRYKIAERLRRLNDLGFDVDEVELLPAEGGTQLRVKTEVAEPGHHRRLLLARTGLHAQENQARSLLNDLSSFRAWLEQTTGRSVSEAVAANKWLSEVYDPVINALPLDLEHKKDQVQIFHEVLEHRWLMSETAGRDVGTTEAARDYFATVLPTVPDDLPDFADSQVRRPAWMGGRHQAP